MSGSSRETSDAVGSADPAARAHAPRRLRADAQRNADSLLEAAKVLFASSGVDVPPKEIADRAGVGVGTLYRHFPRRADLVKAVLRRDIDGCADDGPALSASNPPADALVQWLQRYAELLVAKRGLAASLHSGDPTFDGLPDYFFQRLGPTLQSLVESAAASGDIRADVRSDDLLRAIAQLCQPTRGEGLEHSQRMVACLIDGLRYGAAAPREREGQGRCR